ncbi:MAG: 50S ribosomal protein L3 [Candidatus Marinimicrobia bacterium]|nr:50S ribosomal protein L3 [Candidatus Neomarinimicrobiota bacterium]
MKSIIGIKRGMARIFDEGGKDLPVTVIEAGPCPVSQIKTKETDGYSAVQLAFGSRKAKRTTKALKGHFDKAGIEPARTIREFDYDGKVQIGDVITVDIFEVGDTVKVSGVTKGKGFTGRMKRYGFHGGRASHGKKDQLRAGGSIGASSSPSRVFPGMRMAGRSGNAQRTIANLEVVRVVPEKNQILIKGAVPGPRNGTVYLTKLS